MVPDALSRQPNHSVILEEEDDLEDVIDNSLKAIQLEHKDPTFRSAYLIEAEYKGEFLRIGKYLETMERLDGISDGDYRSL